MKNVNDFATVQDAIDSFPPDKPVALYFPAGVYNFTRDLTITAKTVHLRGDGQNTTELRFGGGTQRGIHIDNSEPGGNGHPVYIGDMSLTTTNNASGTALSIIYQDSFDFRWRDRGLIYNIEIRGVANTNGWQYGIAYSEGVNLSISHVSFLGKHDQADQSESANTQSHAAITWSGDWRPCELRISDCNFVAWEIGVKISETTEGVYIQQCTFLLCTTAIRWYIDKPTDDRWHPLLVVSGSHMNVYKHGFYLRNVIESMLYSNLIYLISTSSDGTALILDACGTTIVHHNILHSFQQQCNGVVLTGGTQYCDVSNNIFGSTPANGGEVETNWDTGIWLQKGTTRTTVRDNSFYRRCRFTEIYDEGAHNDKNAQNVVRNDQPDVRVFTQDDG